VTGQGFSLCTPLSSTNKTDLHDITEILLKVALTTITITPNPYNCTDVVTMSNNDPYAGKEQHSLSTKKFTMLKYIHTLYQIIIVNHCSEVVFYCLINILTITPDNNVFT